MIRVSDLVDFLGQRALSVSSDKTIMIKAFAPLDPGAADHVSFVVGGGDVASQAVTASESSAFVVGPELSPPTDDSRAFVTVANPRLEFARVGAALFPDARPLYAEGIDPTARLGPGSLTEHGVVIEPGVVLGAHCLVGPNSVIRLGTSIGDGVTIGPGCTIGGVGFGFERDEDGRPIRLPHYGGVRIGNNVEIGANTVIDRGVLVDTVIQDYAKIDSQVLVGHNSFIGEGALVIGGSILCGGCHVGEGSWIAPGSIIREKVTVGPDATIGIGSTVMRDVPAGETVMSPGARPALRLRGNGAAR